MSGQFTQGLDKVKKRNSTLSIEETENKKKVLELEDNSFEGEKDEIDIHLENKTTNHKTQNRFGKTEQYDEFFVDKQNHYKRMLDLQKLDNYSNEEKKSESTKGSYSEILHIL